MKEGAIPLLATVEPDRAQKRVVLAVLAEAYVFDALMAIIHALSFPGLFSPTSWNCGASRRRSWRAAGFASTP